MTRSSVVAIRIELQDGAPLIWRDVVVPVTTSLRTLHDVFQAAVPFEGYHLFMFTVAGRRYGRPDPEWGAEMKDARNLRVKALLDRGVDTLTYTYDFGDNWCFDVRLGPVSEEDEGPYPRLLGGARRGPPEDVGGTPGFEAFLEAMADPSHEEHGTLRTWYGGDFDPDEMDRNTIDAAMGKLARRRAVGQQAYEKARKQRAS
jgi:hypothetical protein